MVYEANPFTYRGYYYDRTLDMYYLKSRYYDYKQCRFISPDNVAYLDPQTIGGMNLYAYCLNNPVMGYDPEGTWDWGKFIMDVLSGLAIVGGALTPWLK